MTAAPPPDRHRPPGDADRGTQLGAGTRLLASAFRVPVRAVRAIGGMGRRGWLIAAIAAFVLAFACAAIVVGPDDAAYGAGVGVGVVVAFAAFTIVPALVIVAVVKGAPYV